MNTSIELSEYKPRAGSIESAIVDGLGYCCVHIFWLKYHAVKAEIVADRLGYTIDAIRTHKQRWREGQYPCRERRFCIIRIMEFV